jgi:hypothetical protein
LRRAGFYSILYVEPNARGGKPMRDTLLRIIHELGEQDAIGEASAAECKKRLGADDETFNRLVSQLDQRGYLDPRRAIDSLKLSSTGIRAAEQLR